MAGQVLDLPKELLSEVLDWLPKSDLKEARLTCRRWGLVGARSLFQRLYFAPSKAAMETFREVALNPLFNKHIKELVYDGRLFLKDLASFELYRLEFHRLVNEYYWRKGRSDRSPVYLDWLRSALTKETRDDFSVDPRPRETQYTKALANSHARYSRLLKQQAAILDKALDLECLEMCLQNLPNVSILVIRDTFRHSDIRKANSIHPHAYYDQGSSRAYGCSIEPAGWKDSTDCRGWKRFMKATATHCSNVKFSHLGSGDSKFPLFSHSLPKDELVRGFVKGLTHLTLRCNIPEGLSARQAVTFHKRDNHWRDLPAAARQLIHLDVSGPAAIEVLRGHVWQQLTTLNLSSITLKSSNDLLTMAQAHSNSLKMLQLDSIISEEQSVWDNLGKALGTVLKLQRFRTVQLMTRGYDDDDGDILNVKISSECHLALLRETMQWVAEEMLQIDNHYQGSYWSGATATVKTFSLQPQSV